jgi:hypothetical protein
LPKQDVDSDCYINALLDYATMFHENDLAEKLSDSQAICQQERMRSRHLFKEVVFLRRLSRQRRDALQRARDVHVPLAARISELEDENLQLRKRLQAALALIPQAAGYPHIDEPDVVAAPERLRTPAIPKLESTAVRKIAGGLQLRAVGQPTSALDCSSSELDSKRSELLSSDGMLSQMDTIQASSVCASVCTSEEGTHCDLREDFSIAEVESTLRTTLARCEEDASQTYRRLEALQLQEERLRELLQKQGVTPTIDAHQTPLGSWGSSDCGTTAVFDDTKQEIWIHYPQQDSDDPWSRHMLLSEANSTDTEWSDVEFCLERLRSEMAEQMYRRVGSKGDSSHQQRMGGEGDSSHQQRMSGEGNTLMAESAETDPQDSRSLTGFLVGDLFVPLVAPFRDRDAGEPCASPELSENDLASTDVDVYRELALGAKQRANLIAESMDLSDELEHLFDLFAEEIRDLHLGLAQLRSPDKSAAYLVL